MGYPDDQNLTTRQRLKVWAQIPDNASDADLDALIQRASGALVDQYDAPRFYSGTVTETRSGRGGARMSFRCGPVTAVSSVLVDGVSIPARTSPTGIGYAFDDRILYLVGYEFCRGDLNVQLSYTGGHQPGSREAAAMEQACLVTCNAWWKGREHQDRVSQANGQLGSTSFSQKPLPPEAREIVDHLSRKVPVL